MVGTIWNALAPVPTTATRFPARSVPSTQRAECIARPSKSSMPSMSGSFGRFSWPTALMTAFAVRVPAWAPSHSTVHEAVPSSQRAERTSVSNRMWSVTPWSTITCSK